MHSFWLVAKHEYRTRTGKRSFLLSTFAVPLLIIAVSAIAGFMAMKPADATTLGYIDRSGLLASGAQPRLEDDESRVEMRSFADEAAAQAALENGEIEAYYIVPADYLESRQVDLFYWEDPPAEAVQSQFGDFVRANLVSGQESTARIRLIEGSEPVFRSLDGTRQLGGGNWVGFLLPMAASVIFVFAVVSTANYMLQVVTDEKENRTMEILMTTLSPGQLIGGKAAGLMAVAFTQMGAWIAAIALVVIVGSRYVEALQGVQVPWASLGITLLFFFPAFGLLSGIMTAIGGAVTETRQGQQIAGFLNMLFMLPMFFMALLFTDPNSPFMVALTLFPTTAFVTVGLRWGLAGVPMWQLVASWSILVASAALSIWMASRVFRAGMLRYGQPLSLQSVMATLRPTR